MMEKMQSEMHILREEVTSFLIVQNSRAKELLAESSKRLSDKERELNDLRKILEENQRTIEELLRRLAIAESSNNDGLVDDLRAQLEALKKRFAIKVEDYEDELRRKDKIIHELSARVAFLETREPQTVVDDDALRKLKLKLQDLMDELEHKDRIIEQLRKRLSELEFVQDAPKVHRIKEPPLKEIRYEKDPYLIEQNQRLTKELEEALRQEQAAKMDLKEKLQEIRDLNNLIAELKARPPPVVYKTKTQTKIIDKPTRIGPALEKLMNMYKKRCDEKSKRLALNMLYYFRLFNHYRRLAMERKEKVVVNQKLEVIDGTYDVWKFLRESIVGWLLDVFVRSADRAHVRKM